MQALILAGGAGTRLRPLTLTVAKPVVPILDRPHLAHMVEWLREFGVDDVVLACGHMAEGIREVAGDGTSLGVRLRYVEEPEPRGTGGAVKEAESLLDDTFLVLNGDILSRLDLNPLIEHHEAVGAAATIGLIPVEDPSAFGVVTTTSGGEVKAFIEKPDRDEAPSNLVNAGVYVIEKRVLEGITAEQNVSIEREVFPSLTGNGLHAVPLDGYWLDIGTPERYRQAHWDLLEGRYGNATRLGIEPDDVNLGFDCEIDGEVSAAAWLDDEVVVSAEAVVGPRAAIGAGCVIGERARVESSVLLAGVQVGADATVTDSIIAPNATIEAGSQIGPDAVIGERALVGGALGSGARVAPGES